MLQHFSYNVSEMKSKSVNENYDEKQLENVEYFNYLGSMITNDAR
jgi:hypothetical protein